MDQRQISDWCDDIWPNTPADKRMKVLIEEVAELAVALGLTNGLVQHLETCINRSQLEADRTGFKESPSGEAADVFINLAHLVDFYKIDLASSVDAKMAINMAKPKEHYEQKAKIKKELGI